MTNKKGVIDKRVFIVMFALLLMNMIMANAQQFKIGKNTFNVRSSAVLELEDPNQALLITRVFNPNTAIHSASMGMIAFDSSINKLAYHDGTTWVYPSTSDSSIYKYDGSLIGNRVINMGVNTLRFIGNTTTFQGTNPINLFGVQLTTATANNTDSILVINNGVVNKIPNSTLLDSNIYTRDGALTIDRTVYKKSNYLRFVGNTSGDTVMFSSNGSVGIGTTKPISALQVIGAIRADSLVLRSLSKGASMGATDSLLMIDNTGIVKKVAPPSTGLDSSIYSADGTLRGNRTVTMGKNNLTFSSSDGTFIFNSSGSGKVGIGTTSPGQLLDVNGTTQLKNLVLTNLTTGTGSDNILVIDASNNVKKVAPGGGSGWGLTGNAGTSAGTNFIGTTDNQNVVFKRNTIQAGSLGINNTSFGVNALLSPTGTNNTGVGSDAIRYITSGKKNTAIGYQAMFSLTTGSNNVAVGDGAGINLITGTDNTFVGESSGYLTTSSYNTAIGSFAGTSITTGSNNTILGYSAAPALNTGSNNIIIGNGAASYLQVGNNNIAIGNSVTVAYADNYMLNIGNTIYGTNVGVTGTPAQIGIGTPTPSSALQVIGAVRADSLVLTNLSTGTSSDNVLVIDGSNNVKKVGAISNIYTADGSLTGNRTVTMGAHNLVFSTTEGNVGIGIITPGAKLDVNGDIRIPYPGSIQVGDNLNNSPIMRVIYTTGDETQFKSWVNKSSPNNNFMTFHTANTERIRILSNGNVGIGTTSPAYTLDITGNIRATGTSFAVTHTNTSDARLKKDILPIQGALSKVLQLQGVTYTWRKDMEKESGYQFKDGKDYGVIAQEIQNVLPELVTKDTKGFLTVDYPHITPILIEAIKEQQNQINELRNMLQQLMNDKKQ